MAASRPPRHAAEARRRLKEYGLIINHKEQGAFTLWILH
jgi:hypothetical protein